jgi:hypothetical protein
MMTLRSLDQMAGVSGPRDGRLRGELRQAIEGFRPQGRCISRDCHLACLFDARHSPVQCRDQFLELTHEFMGVHHHLRPPRGPTSRRPAFQTSPQAPQRQYAFSSGFRAEVLIDRD